MIYKGDIQISELKVGSTTIVRSMLNNKSVYEQSSIDLSDNVLPTESTGPWNKGTIIGDTGWVPQNGATISMDDTKTWNGYSTILVDNSKLGFNLGEPMLLEPGTTYMQKAMVCSEVDYTGSDTGPLHSWEKFNDSLEPHDHIHFQLGLYGMNQSGKANQWTLLYRSITTTSTPGTYSFRPFLYCGYDYFHEGRMWLAWYSVEKLKL